MILSYLVIILNYNYMNSCVLFNYVIYFCRLAECGRYIHEEMHERESSMNEKIHARPGSMLGGN